MSIEVISRQAALDITPKTKANRDYRTNNLDDAYDDGFNDALNAIAEIPVAHIILPYNNTQEGRWDCSNPYWDFENKYVVGRCSNCDFSVHEITNYCPNCGAKMMNENEEMSKVSEMEMAYGEYLND